MHLYICTSYASLASLSQWFLLAIISLLSLVFSCPYSSKVPRNDETALKLYSAGASLGDPWCTYTLATWLCQGRGGEEDWEKGFELHITAANNYGK